MKKINLFALLLLVALPQAKAQSLPTYSLDFDANNYTVQTFTYDKVEYKVRAYENIVYVANPVDTAYQKMNIYVPEAYYSAGTKINGYSIDNAPIFFPNGIGGYMAAPPQTLNPSPLNVFGRPRSGESGLQRGGGMRMPQMPGDTKEGSAIHYALTKGYIVAAPGARGRSLINAQGVYIGKAPAGLVDLKAAVCYLRHNVHSIPGDKGKIISNGTSAGGAMSLLLGATGNSIDFKPYLEELGAADRPDDILAVSAYCPITNLDHADCAYEWQFNGIDTYEAGMMAFLEGNSASSKDGNRLTERQQLASNQLKLQFPIYLNSLQLVDVDDNPLTLDENGEGSFKELVVSYVLAAAQQAIDSGQDLSNISWLTVKNNRAAGLDFAAYVRSMGRMKTPPAFDAFDLSAPENHLFGTDAINAQHFTRYSFDNAEPQGTLAQTALIRMMNPMYYIGSDNCTNARYWHIRYGTIDNNTSLAIEVILATYLQDTGHVVDFALAWDRPHMGDYDLEELFGWIDKWCK